MKFIAQKNDLKAALKAVSSTVGNGSVMAVLGNVQLKVEGTTLTLSTSAIEVATVTKIAVASAKEGSCSIDAKKFSQLIYSSPSMDIACEFREEGGKFIIRSGKSKYELPALTEAFPVLGAAEEKASLMVSQAKLAAIFHSTKSAASKDETRIAICGNHIELKDGYLRTVTTDGRRMAMNGFAVDSDVATSMTIPNRAIDTVLPILGQGTDVKLTIKGTDTKLTQAIFHIQPGEESPLVDGIVFTCKLIEAGFPNYRVIIPKDEGTIIDLNREDFIDGLSRATIVTSSAERSTTLRFSGMFMSIEAKTDAGRGHEELPLPVSIDGISMTLNPDYLVQALSGSTEEEISIGVRDPGSALVLKSGDYYCVVMPLRS
jgi:DNA polymerase-3 subunit beta